MAFSSLSTKCSSTTTTTTTLPPSFQPFNLSFRHQTTSTWFTKPKTTSLRLFSCYASSSAKPAKPQSKKRSNANTNKRKNTKNANSNGSSNGKGFSTSRSKSSTLDIDADIDGVDVDVDDDGVEVVGSLSSTKSERYQPLPLPKPPAGFVLDDQGRVLMASNKRIATIVDSTNNLPLECIIRRVFKSSAGDECMLLCPVDTPVQILKSTNIEGWSAVSDEEVEAILPTASYALAKIHMHLVYSGFCYTARGGFCYTEDDIIEFRTDNGRDLDGLPTEGVEITCFHIDGSHYMIYTPSDPLLFVSVKDENGLLKIADDELLEDPAIISAIDEETEFNALVEEEAALLESLLGKD